MRNLSLFCFLLGVVASEPFFPSGREYEFDYEGRILSGIPELESHFAGFTVKSKVILQAVESERFKLALRNVRFVKFNEKLTGPEPMNWRTLRIPEDYQTPAEYETILETPIEFSMIDGEISKIQVSQEEPEWATNFKKSLVSLMKVKTSGIEEKLSQNIVRGQEGELPTTWKTMEEGVDGKCENTYDVIELPEYMLREINPELIKGEHCEGKKIFQILKSRNVNKCVKRSAYQLNQPGKLLCPTGNCGNMWQRSSQTRYIACGANMKDMELQFIVNEGELQQSLLAFNTEDVVTGTKQILKKVQVKSSLSTLPRISSPRTVEDLLYEYPQNVHLEGKTAERDFSSFEEQQRRLQKQPISNQRLAPALSDVVISKVSPTTLKQKIMEKIIQVVRDLKEVEQFEKKVVAQKVTFIRNLFSLLNTEQMKSVYEEIKRAGTNEEERELARQLTLEISVTCGTSPAVKFIKELIENGEVSVARTGLILTTLPHYIRTPTISVIEEIFELVKSDHVQKNAMVKANAEIAFATIVNRACIDKYRMTRFPVFVFGEFCNAKTSELTTKYIPYFVEQLHSGRTEGEVETAIIALGTLGHPSVVPILIPFIQGKVGKISPLQQRMAIFSLNHVSEEYRETLLPVVISLIHNPSEDKDVRIAALSMFMHLKPSTVHYQRLASSTWFEKDVEFHKFVYSTLKSLSEIETVELPSYSTMLYHNSLKAKTVFTLVKPVPGIISSTLNYFTSEWINQLQAGYHFNGFFSTTHSIQQVYGRMEYFLEKLKFTPIEFCFNMHGSGQLIDTINRIFGSEVENIHPEWRNMISSINLKPLEESPFSAGMWVKLMDDVNVLYGVNAKHMEPMLRSLKQAVSEPRSLKEKICGKTPINLLKVDDYAPTKVVIPSEMGMPILVEFNMPAVFAVKGEVDIDCSGSMPRVSVELTHKAAVAASGLVGTICPFTEELVAVGINQQWTVNYPVKVNAKVEMGKLEIVSVPTKEMIPSTESVDLMSFSLKPYAVIQPLSEYSEPLIRGKHTKIIKTESEKKTGVIPFGRTLGLDMKYIITSESGAMDMKTAFDYLKLWKYNPVNGILFTETWTALRMDGKPSLRFHEEKIVYNPSKSSTKRIELDLSMTLLHQQWSQQTKYYSLEAQNSLALQVQQAQEVSQEHQQQIKRLQSIDTKEGLGLVAKLNAKFIGGSNKEYSYFLSMAHGRTEMEQKWHLHLENSDVLSVCMDGELKTPSIPLRSIEDIKSRDIEFSYKNEIRFGKTCEEHKIRVTGTTSVSREQKQRASESRESRKCEEAIRNVDRIKEELRRCEEGSAEYRRLQKELVRTVEDKIEFCRQHLRKQATLDRVVFKIEYSPMPEYVKQPARMVDTIVKGVLLPYIARIERESTKNEVKVELNFNPHLNTVDMVLKTEDETVKYQNIRLPEKMRSFVPLVASKSIKEQVISSLKGESMYPKCIIGDNVVKRFDNSSYSYQLDDCYHVLASECSKKFSHSVLGKKVDGKIHIQIYTHESKVELKPASSYSEGRKEYEILVDGQRVQVERHEKKEVPSKDRKMSYHLTRTEDDVVILETRYNRISYDAKTVEIEKTKMHVMTCGVCGTQKSQKSQVMLSAQSCAVQSAQAAALSFRKKDSCSPLTQQQQQLLQQECIVPKVVKTPVTLIQLSKMEKCSQMKHSLIRQSGKLCISQIPIVECGTGCSAKNTLEKRVPFTCLPTRSERVVRRYEEKVRRGEILPELRNMEKSFTAELEVPTSCAFPSI